jgi:hypothetical protein
MRPRGDGFDQLSDAEVLNRVVAQIEALPRRLQLGLKVGLRLLDWSPLASYRKRLSRLPPDEARVFLEQRIPAAGVIGQVVRGVRALVMIGFYQHPDILRSLGVDWEGRRHAMTARRAELLRTDPVPERRLEYPNVFSGATAEREMRFDADVVVVGTGTGGAATAGAFTDMGFRVLMLEEGGLHLTDSFTTDPSSMGQRLYRDGGTTVIAGKPPILFAEGRCVGGSSTVNGGMCWRTPERVLESWSRNFGLHDISMGAMAPYFDRAEEILHVEPNHEDTYGKHGIAFVEGADRLGWRVERNRRDMRRCVGLNNCVFGCPTGAKQSMLVTEIPRALKAGAQLVTHAQVRRVQTKGSRAVGVTGYLLDESERRRHRFRASGRLIVLAAGARMTPGLLMRSRLSNDNLGRHLRTHPNAKVVGLFDRPLDPWIGAHQTHQVHEFLDDGILIAYATLSPGLLASGLPGLGEEHGDLMRQYNHMLVAAALVEDEGEGHVSRGLDGEPQMHFALSSRDVETIHRGVERTAELLVAAGAREVLLPFAHLPSLKAGELNQLQTIARRPEAIDLVTVHIMGSARMAADPRQGVVDYRGMVHGVKGLAVADASLFPTSIGVNPQETIVALALRNADRQADALRAV